MFVRCKELVCPCIPVLGIIVKANDHPPPITTPTAELNAHKSHLAAVAVALGLQAAAAAAAVLLHKPKKTSASQLRIPHQ